MIIATIVGTTGMLEAAPYYYTWEGFIRPASDSGSIYDDSAGAIAAAGLAEGSPVSFTVLIDQNRQGLRTLNDGTQVYYDNSFYAEFISGSGIEPVNGGYYNASDDVASYNYGNHPNGATYITTGSDNHRLRVIIGTLIDNWYEGMSFYFVAEHVVDENGLWSQFDATIFNGLKLVTISDTYPGIATPIPSTISLFCLGILGLAGLNRKKQ